MVLEKVGFENLRMCKYREKSNPNINTLGIGSFEGYRPPRVIQLRVEKLINKKSPSDIKSETPLKKSELKKLKIFI